ncbi:MAG TPA: hypothetical protein VGO89_22435, partial [Streptomyces sp.]|nr:hypothetical protein [Streptomyces sp.]
GPGDDHAFRPVADETTCASCRRTVAEAKPRDSALPATGYTPWRDRFTAINGSPGLPVAG